MRSLILLACLVPFAAKAADDPAIDALQKAASPALMQVLQSRFPDYVKVTADRLHAAPPGVPAAVPLADMLASIQSHEGDKLIYAPDDSLRAIFVAQADLATALSKAQPGLCGALAGASQAFHPPTLDIADLNDKRTAAILTAIADGRDHPVEGRRANPDDYAAFTRDAKQGGIAVGTWAVLSPSVLRTAPSSEVCAAIISVSNALVAGHDALTPKVMTDMAEDMLVRDATTYRAAMH
jgi:hypothetical protein